MGKEIITIEPEYKFKGKYIILNFHIQSLFLHVTYTLFILKISVYTNIIYAYTVWPEMNF